MQIDDITISSLSFAERSTELLNRTSQNFPTCQCTRIVRFRKKCLFVLARLWDTFFLFVQILFAFLFCINSYIEYLSRWHTKFNEGFNEHLAPKLKWKRKIGDGLKLQLIMMFLPCGQVRDVRRARRHLIPGWSRLLMQQDLGVKCRCNLVLA